MKLRAHNSVVNAKDLCKLIKVGSKYRVAEVRLGELHLVFDPKDKSVRSTLKDTAETKHVDEATKNIAEESVRKDLADKVDQDLDQLQLSDPLAYEDLIGGRIVGVGD